MPSQRRMLTVAAVAAAAVALGFWWIRDLPRQRVEKALTQRLGRPVTVAKLRVAAPDRFRLEGVAAAGVAGMPWLGRVRLEDVEIEGGARDLLAGRIDALRIHGGSVHLVQPPWPEEEPLPPSELEVGRLEVERLEVLVPAATETEPPARLTLAGSMEHFRGALDEQLELTFHGTAERFELAPVAAFALALANPLAPGAAPGGALEDLQLELRWPGASGAAPSPGPRLELDLTARGGEVLTTAGRAVLDSPAIHATTDAAMRSASASWTAGSVRLEPRDRPAQTLTSPSLELVYASDPDADQAPASLEVDTQLAPLLPKAHAALGWRSGALSTVDATTADIELASLLPWLGLPPEVELAGRGRLSITTSEGVVAGTVELDLPRVVAKLAAGTIEAREASVSLETTWSLTEESKLLELAGRLRTGNLTLPGPGAAPARLDDARLEADARLVPDRWSELPNGPLGPDALLRLLEGPLSVRADLPRGTAGAKGDLLAGALPVRLEATLTASDAPKDPDTSPARLEVHARTASLGAGRISGPVLPGAPATGWDWQWSWSLPDLAPAFDTARTWAAGAGAELPEDLRVGGAAKARGTLRGGLDAPRLSASLELEGASIGVADQALDAIEGSLRVRWPVAGNNRQHRSALAVDRISLAARARPSGLAELPLELEGSGSWGGERTEIGSLKLSTETQGTLEVSGWLAPPAAELD
ncbi:MAG: hypothetical protein KDD11_11800, partial [Acidobacteria bacterium]|nr:hypothetical protein [Acidobacteriota bacterium]